MGPPDHSRQAASRIAEGIQEWIPLQARTVLPCGIKIINMYGLTETSPVITINRTEKGMVKLGSVGMPIKDVEIKIADDGEILCKGPNVMMGYYNDPDLTNSVFDKDGWFCTGDIGKIEDGKFLMVTDRKKEIFKLSNGKFRFNITKKILQGLNFHQKIRLALCVI